MGDQVRVAVTEVGSRAVRLLVADVARRQKLQVVATEWAETQLAHRFEAITSDDQIRVLLRSLASKVREFGDRAIAAGATRSVAFGTATLRSIEARNRQILRTEIPGIRVFTRSAEAMGSLAAAIQTHCSTGDCHDGHTVIAVDQGAGSMEIAVGRQSNGILDLLDYRSYSLGTGNLVADLRKFGWDVDRLWAKTRKRVNRWKPLEAGASADVVILGSAATKIGWISVQRDVNWRYDPRRVDGAAIRKQVAEAFVRAATTDRDVAAQILGRGVADLDELTTVVGGIVGLVATLDWLGRGEFVVSALGTRFGVAQLLVNQPEAISGSRP